MPRRSSWGTPATTRRPARSRRPGTSSAGLRDLLNADPLALWQGGGVDTARLGRLRKQAAAAAARAAEIGRVRADAQRRISAAAAAVSAAAAAFADAVAARDRAAARIAAAELPPPPAETAGLDVRLAALDKLKAAGRWARLAAELDTIEAEAAAAGQRYRDAQRAAAALAGQARRAARPARTPTRSRRRGWEPPRTANSAGSMTGP